MAYQEAAIYRGYAIIHFTSGFRLACDKCRGTGFIKYYAYNDEGVCYACSGGGYRMKAKLFASQDALVEHYEKLAEGRRKREAIRTAKWEAQREANIAEYQRREAAAELERQARLDAQTYLDGEFGDIVEVEGTVVASFNVDTKYGVSRLVKVQAGTASVKFFSTANFAFDLFEGDNVKVVGELVGRDLYNGNKETTIKRTKLAK